MKKCGWFKRHKWMPVFKVYEHENKPSQTKYRVCSNCGQVQELVYKGNSTKYKNTTVELKVEYDLKLDSYFIEND